MKSPKLPLSLPLLPPSNTGADPHLFSTFKDFSPYIRYIFKASSEMNGTG